MSIMDVTTHAPNTITIDHVYRRPTEGPIGPARVRPRRQSRRGRRAGVAGTVADAHGYAGAITIVAALSAASGLWVLFDMSAGHGEQLLHPWRSQVGADAGERLASDGPTVNVLAIVNDQPCGSERPDNRRLTIQET